MRFKGVDREPDYWRQLDVFSPLTFTRPVTVIGAGATGSYMVWLLAKMGCRDITVYDDDDVENYNLPNQIYGTEDVGKGKVEALADAVRAATGVTIRGIHRKFSKGKIVQRKGGVVFLLTDTMESRKKIWNSSIKNRKDVDMMIETRMGIDGGRIYAVRPSDEKQIAGYEKTLYTDAEAEESPCTSKAIAPTAATIAGIAVSTMLNFVRDKRFPNETIISLSPMLMLNKYF